MRTIGPQSRVWPIGLAIVTLTVCWVQAMAVKVSEQPAVQPPAQQTVQVVVNPAAKPAEYIGEARCIECHGQENKHFSETLHAKVFRLNPKNDASAAGLRSLPRTGLEPRQERRSTRPR